MASLTRTHGKPCFIRFMNPMLISVASASMRPASTVIPARSSASVPWPLTRGLGSCTAKTTRPMRASIKAFTQGGVRPKWLQGSRVTYAVAPATGSLAARRAATSACASPARSCQPSAMIRSPLAMTQPTRGFGCVVSKPRSASANARVIASRSNSLNITSPPGIVHDPPPVYVTLAPVQARVRAGNATLVYPGPGNHHANPACWYLATPLLATVSRSVRRQQRQLITVGVPGRLLAALAFPGSLRGCTLTAQPLDLIVEGLYILKMAIHRGKSHVSHFVELPQLLHDELADDPGRYLPVTDNPYLVSNTAQGLINGLTRNRPLLQGLLHPGAQLRLVIRLANVVRLHDDGHHQLGSLERSEPLAAGQTFTPTTYLPPLTRQA